MLSSPPPHLRHAGSRRDLRGHLIDQYLHIVIAEALHSTSYALSLSLRLQIDLQIRRHGYKRRPAEPQLIEHFARESRHLRPSPRPSLPAAKSAAEPTPHVRIASVPRSPSRSQNRNSPCIAPGTPASPFFAAPASNSSRRSPRASIAPARTPSSRSEPSRCPCWPTASCPRRAPSTAERRARAAAARSSCYKCYNKKPRSHPSNTPTSNWHIKYK